MQRRGADLAEQLDGLAGGRAALDEKERDATARLRSREQQVADEEIRLRAAQRDSRASLDRATRELEAVEASKSRAQEELERREQLCQQTVAEVSVAEAALDKARREHGRLQQELTRLEHDA